MKRFLLFGFCGYDAAGGMDDMLESFDSVDDCHEAIATRSVAKYPFYQIFDCEERELVQEFQDGDADHTDLHSLEDEPVFNVESELARLFAEG